MARNERFADARQALNLTEEQVAELVADYLQGKRDDGASKRGRPAIDGDHVSRIETGRIKWPNREYREGLRAVLCATSDAELGFHPPRSAPRLASVDVGDGDRMMALTSAATLGVLDGASFDAMSAGLSRPGTPKRIGRIDVDDLHHVINGMEHADHAAGGRTVVRSLALEQLSWTQDALKLASFRTTEVRLAWMTAVARLGRLAGFMSVDARDQDTARKCFLIALQIAAGADDWPSRLNVLSGMTRQAVHLGDGGIALKMVTLAKAGDGFASATTRAMIRVLEARAYGVLGRVAEAVNAVQQAETLYEDRQPDDDPPWLWFYDEAQLYGDTGHALYPLALAGADVDAEARLTRAVDMHAPGDTRGRTFSLVKLASLQVRHRPDSDSYAKARRAVGAVSELRSGRALDYLNDLGRVLRRTGTDEASAIAASVTETLAAVRRD